MIASSSSSKSRNPRTWLVDGVIVIGEKGEESTFGRRRFRIGVMSEPSLPENDSKWLNLYYILYTGDDKRTPKKIYQKLLYKNPINWKGSINFLHHLTPNIWKKIPFPPVDFQPVSSKKIILQMGTWILIFWGWLFCKIQPLLSHRKSNKRQCVTNASTTSLDWAKELQSR